MRYIYLAGPINGCDEGEAKEWRKYVSSRFDKGIIGISPLRCEPLIDKTYTNKNPDPRFGIARAIKTKNFLDVQNCDLSLIYLPKWANDRRPSYGTVMELGWSSALQKPIILVSDDHAVYEHPVIEMSSGWILKTLDQAVEVINGVFADYV